MYTFHCYNKQLKVYFYKTFYSQYKARIFRYWCRFSKIIFILSYTGDLDC